MNLTFGNNYTTIKFSVVDDRLFLQSIAFGGKNFIEYAKGMEHGRVFLVGGHYPDRLFNRYGGTSEKLQFVDFQEVKEENAKKLIVLEKNEKILVKTVYTLLKDSGTVSVYREVENISETEITLECVSPFTVKGIMLDEIEKAAQLEISCEKEQKTTDDPTAEISVNIRRLVCGKLPYFWKANNTWHSEADFQRLDLNAEGMLCRDKMRRCAKISVTSNGTQTTNRYLPLGLFEKEEYGYFFFEIEPTGSWSYEIEAGLNYEDENEVTLCVTGRTLCDNGWYKTLKTGERYQTEIVRFVGAKDVDGVLKEMTISRRQNLHLFPKKACDRVIYNVFNHNVYATPSEQKDEKILGYIGEYDIDDYVIDAGWFDNGSTHALGVWDENVVRYPNGVSKTKWGAKELGMEFGLWVELQSYGIFCANQQILPEYCLFHINGVRTVCNGRYQLNYAYQEVRDYADGIIKKIVERYDPTYIKIDYNQTQVATTDVMGESSTETLRRHCEGYLKWFREIQEKYPHIVFETCASGGLFMDTNIASIANVFSISDQWMYYNYPPIIANLSMAILPEQKGLWVIPVSRVSYPNTYDEEVIMNMINSFFGVMHLCSKMEVLNERQRALVKEGIIYYRSLANVRKTAIPVLPNGFCRYDDKTMSFGLKTDEKLYLSVYNLSEESQKAECDLSKYGVKSVELVFPKHAKNEYALNEGKFNCSLASLSARTFEFNIEQKKF